MQIEKNPFDRRRGRFSRGANRGKLWTLVSSLPMSNGRLPYYLPAGLGNLAEKPIND
jgi:hypothetical protein